MTIDKENSTILLAILVAILVGGLWVFHFSHKCSIIHPELCDNSCIIDSDCYSSAKCGCIAISEQCLGDDDSEIDSSSCKCVNNLCQIARFGDQDIACNSNFNCRLVYTGDKPCSPCDSSIDDYRCLNSKKAQEIRDEKEQYRENKEIECGACPLPEYTCVCEIQSCEKIKNK